MRVPYDKIEELIEDARGTPHSKTKKRAKRLGTHYRGITKTSIVKFFVESETTKGVTWWRNYARINDLSIIKSLTEIDHETLKEKILDLIKESDIDLVCGCPSSTYWGYRFIRSKVDSVIGWKEHRYPKVRNPDLQGFCCKHEAKTLYMLPYVAEDIAKDIRNWEFISTAPGLFNIKGPGNLK